MIQVIYMIENGRLEIKKAEESIGVSKSASGDCIVTCLKVYLDIIFRSKYGLE